MVEAPITIEGFKITKWYKYLLYIAGVVLILSFFFDVKGLEVSAVRQFALNTVFLGLFFWILDDILEIITNVINEHSKKGNSEYAEAEQAIAVIMVIYYVLVIFGIFVWSGSFDIF